MKKLTLAEKKKLVPKGKRLNGMKVKHKAEEILGATFRKDLAEGLGCSESLITQAFKEQAPYALFSINEYIKNYPKEKGSNC